MLTCKHVKANYQLTKGVAELGATKDRKQLLVKKMAESKEFRDWVESGQTHLKPLA